MSITRTASALSATAVAALLLAGCSNSTADPAASSQNPAPGNSASAPSPTSTGATAGGCFVELFDGDDADANSESIRITEAGRFSTLADLPGASQDWTGEADSVRVGPDATVTIWPQKDFGGDAVSLDPGTVRNTDPEPSSLELSCGQ